MQKDVIRVVYSYDFKKTKKDSLKKKFMHYIWYILFLFFLQITNQLYSVSIVYTMKLQRIFSSGNVAKKEDVSSTSLTGLPFLYFRNRHIAKPDIFAKADDSSDIDIYERRKAQAFIIDFRHIAQSGSWADITTGLIRDESNAKGTSIFKEKKYGLDDIILSFGTTKKYNKKYEMLFYGLAGFPAKRKVTQYDTFDTFAGTRFFGTGAGIEFSYTALHNDEQSCIFLINNRFVHFYKRAWNPIFSLHDKIIPGNITDILCALYTRHKKTVFEIGYNPTFFTNQRRELSSQKISEAAYTRNAGYIILSHGSFGIGTSRAYEKLFSSHIQTYWLYLNYTF